MEFFTNIFAKLTRRSSRQREIALSRPEFIKLFGGETNPGDTRSEEEFLRDYHKFRGKCKQLAEDAVKQDRTLTLVRGYYICESWGKQTHWWTTRPDGTVFDPSCRQFPSKGSGRYIPFSGEFVCDVCGKAVAESDVYQVELGGEYALCSAECYGKYLGVDIGVE